MNKKGMVSFFLFFVLTACATTPQESENDSRLQSTMTTDKNTDITSSASDNNSYRQVLLDNGMEVLLVSSDDPTAAAVVDVRVGSNSNPDNLPGLAHFLEHLLFLGTKKYPEPDSYQKFISTNGGSYNATTGAEHTNYFFAIDSHKLEPALDRLAQFFIAPILDPQYVDRELAIVESEFQRHHNSEGRAFYRVVQENYNPKHPSSRFSAGNTKSLLSQGRDTLYKELVAFYKKYYSANQMKLVVQAQKPLDELEQLVRQYFTPVVNSNAPKVTVNEPLYAPGSLPKFVQIKPKSEIYRLSYAFPVTKEEDWRYVKSASFITHLIGHEAPGSLLQALRDRGWARGLSAGQYATAGELLVSIGIDLTQEGRRHIGEIHQAVFSWLGLIRQQGLERWRYQELQRMGDIAFDNQEQARAITLTRTLSRVMHYVPVEHLFTSLSLYAGWNKVQAQRVIDDMTPENVIITLTAPDVATNTIAQWYPIPYSVGTPNVQQMQQLSNITLALPPVNNFIPGKHVQVVQKAEPKQIERNEMAVWHIPTPSHRRANISLGVLSSQYQRDLKTRLLTRIYLRALQQRIASQVYMASLAGLGYQLYDHLSGISLRVTGYADKLPLFFDKLVDEISRWDMNEKEFTNYHADMLRSIRNNRNNTPGQRVGNRMSAYLLSERAYIEQQQEALEVLTYQDWLAWRRLQTETPRQLTMLGYGEISKAQLSAAAETAVTHFAAPVEIVNNPGVRILDESTRYVTETTTPKQTTEVLQLYLQMPEKTLHNQIAAQLLASHLRSPFFHLLRTERKLGYQASVFPYILLEQSGIGFVVESDKVSAVELAPHFEDFIGQQNAVIDALSDADFLQLQQGVIANLRRSDTTIDAQSTRFWRELNRGNTRFNTRERMIEVARQFTKEDLQKIWHEYIANNSHKLWALTSDEATLPTGFGRRVE